MSTHISWTYIVLSWASDTSRKANLQEELAATVIRGSQLRYSPLNIVLADSRNLSAEFYSIVKAVRADLCGSRPVERLEYSAGIWIEPIRLCDDSSSRYIWSADPDRRHEQ